MQTVRRMIDENPAAWTKALKRAQAAGFVLAGDRYARPKKRGSPRCSTRYTTARPSRWNDSEPDPAFFGTAALVDVLKEAFAALVPLYRLLIAAVERDIEQAGDAATA